VQRHPESHRDFSAGHDLRFHHISLDLETAFFSWRWRSRSPFWEIWRGCSHHHCAEIGGQKWGNYVHESGIFSLVPYLPAIIGLLVVGG